jgi:hypothetical protein
VYWEGVRTVVFALWKLDSWLDGSRASRNNLRRRGAAVGVTPALKPVTRSVYVVLAFVFAHEIAAQAVSADPFVAAAQVPAPAFFRRRNHRRRRLYVHDRHTYSIHGRIYIHTVSVKDMHAKCMHVHALTNAYIPPVVAATSRRRRTTTTVAAAAAVGRFFREDESAIVFLGGVGEVEERMSDI